MSVSFEKAWPEIVHAPQAEQEWSEWIEWKGGECPIPQAMAGEWQIMSSSEEWCWSEPQPWYPPQQEGFGPWVEHDGSIECPVSPRSIVAWVNLAERAAQRYTHTYRHADELYWGASSAYCVAITADEPSKGEVEATQTPQSPEQYVADIAADEAAHNKPMVNRDFRPPSHRELNYQASKHLQNAAVATPTPEPPAGLDVVAPMVRLGGTMWGL